MDDFDYPDSDYSDFQKYSDQRRSLVEDRNHPNHWFNRSTDLHASARVLWNAMVNDAAQGDEAAGHGSGYSYAVACHPVYYMLCGLSLELIMKALLVQRGLEPKKFEVHKFDRLIELLGQPVDKSTRKLLRFYEASLVWEGRYPLPRNATDSALIEHWKLSSEVLTSPVKEIKGIKLRQSNGAGDWENFHTLWRSFADQFSHS